MDALADLLTASRVRGTVGATIEAGEAWGYAAPQKPGAAIHAVTAGTAWLGLPDLPPLELMPGDVVLLPAGTAHRLGSDAGTVLGDANDAWAWADAGVVTIGSGPVRTHILCASYEHDPAMTTSLMTLLPTLVHVRAEHAGSGLDDTVRLLARELAHPQLASAVVLDRMVDILLVQLLRVWLASEPERPGPSWLRGLCDPVVGAALGKLHQDPARPWTTATLAAELSVSRATLSRRFPLVLGETPGAYLTRWRMDLAALRLRDTDDSLEAIAGAVGYTSVYAFNRAFRRARAQPPGRYRVASRLA